MSETPVAPAADSGQVRTSPQRLQVRMTRGMETMVRSNAAIERTIKEMTREIRSTNEMLSRAATGGSASPLAMVGADGRISTPIPMAPPTSDVPSTDVVTAPRPSSDYSGPVGPGTPPVLGVHDPEGGPVEDEEVSNWDAIMARRGYSVSRLRRDVGASMAEQIGTRLSQIPTPPLRQGSAGNWMRVDPDTGRFVRGATASEVRRMHLANRARTVGGAIAEQGLARGLVNSLPKGAVGPIGLAVAAGYLGKEVVAQFENQRAENARYQRVSGGDNLSGFLDRGRERLFTFSQMGTMDSREAARLYQEVYDLGLQGDSRQNALEMASQNWRRFGMEVADSIELLRTNAQNGMTSLQGLAESLDMVTESARETGVNADTARDRFATTFGAAAPSLLGEGSASLAAGALAAATTRLGRGYENVDLSGIFSEANITRLAGTQGMTPGQFMAATSGVEGGALMVRAAQASVIDMARVLFGPAESLIGEYKAANNIVGPLSSRQADEVAAQIMQQYPRINPQSAMQMLRSVGIQGVPFNKAVSVMVQVLDGSWNPEAEMGALEASFRQGEVDVTDTRAVANAIEQLGIDLPNYADEDFDLLTSYQLASYHMTTGLISTSFERAQAGELRRVMETGEFSPIIAGLLKEGNQSRRFLVNDGTEQNPRWREVSTKDLLEHYRDQAARGDVQIVGEGQTISESLGLGVDETVNVTYGKNLGIGQEASRPEGYQGVEGRIEIAPTAELRDLLRFRWAGSANMSATPLPSQGANDEYPTGG